MKKARLVVIVFVSFLAGTLFSSNLYSIDSCGRCILGNAQVGVGDLGEGKALITIYKPYVLDRIDRVNSYQIFFRTKLADQ